MAIVPPNNSARVVPLDRSNISSPVAQPTRITLEADTPDGNIE